MKRYITPQLHVITLAPLCLLCSSDLQTGIDDENAAQEPAYTKGEQCFDEDSPLYDKPFMW